MMKQHTWRWAAATLLAIAGLGIGLHAWLLTDLPDVATLENSLRTPSIRITDRHGRQLFEIISGEDGRNRVIPLEDIPQACIDATLATEDASFYQNPGVSLRGLLRAAWINLRGGDTLAGGSTITQQVVRNHLLDPSERAERTLTRKLREIILAYRLTQRFSKDDILAVYLNQTYYGSLAYGLEAAAQAYFGKSARDLSTAECALLAGLPQAPSIYDPLTDPQAARERQRVVLNLMADNGYITSQQAEIAAGEALRFSSSRYSIEAPHFVMAVYSQLERELPPETLYAGGLVVRTSLDLDWQHAAERIATRQLALLNNAEVPAQAGSAAVVALDPHSGQVLAMLGSPDYTDPSISGAVNLAIAPRQPGSTLKPFTYALAFDPANPQPWTPATMILDVRTSFVTREGFAYTPVNYDLREHGPVSARVALASSYNIPAVIALDQVGLGGLLNLLGRLGITTLRDPEQYGLSLTLGGGEIRLLELTAAYGALANGGTAVRPVMILEVQDAAGQTVYAPPSGLGSRVLDARVAWLISDILSDNEARSPSFGRSSVLQVGRPAAVKTGTTTDYRDNWTIGYTPDLVIGAWVGNADGSPMINISGVSGAGPIWHQMLREVARGQRVRPFVQPPGFTQVRVCTLSGLLPSADCPYTRLEWFIEGTQPTRPDDIYQRIDGRLYLNLPPQAHGWARAQGLPLLADAPPQFAGQAISAQDQTAGLIITYPEERTIFQINPLLPLSAQRIRLAAAGPPGTAQVTFYLNGQPLGTVDQAPFEMFWQPEIGRYVVQAQALHAAGEPLRSGSVSFDVRLPLDGHAAHPGG